MNKQIVAAITIFGVLLATLVLVYSFTNRSPSGKPNVVLNQEVTTYFHGVTCPNCKELNSWINKNKIDDKVKFEKREVYYNKDNAELLIQAAQICQIPENQIGVPFVFSKGKCFIGTPEAQKFFTDQAKKSK